MKHLTQTINSKKRIFAAAFFILILICVLGITMCLCSDNVYAASKPAKVTMSIYPSGDGYIYMEWKKAKHAKKYEVYRATSKDGKYVKKATLSRRYYSDKNLIYGKTYYYKVRGVNGKKKGSFSKIKYAKLKLMTPDIYSITSNDTEGYVKLKWDKANHNTGYKVYRSYTKKGTYKLIGTTSNTYYYDRSCKLFHNCYYKVRTYKKDGSHTYYSSYSPISSIYYEPDPVVAKENVNITYTKMENGDYIATVENNNRYCVYCEITYWSVDEDGNMIDCSTTYTGDVIGANQTGYIEIYSSDVYPDTRMSYEISPTEG